MVKRSQRRSHVTSSVNTCLFIPVELFRLSSKRPSGDPVKQRDVIQSVLNHEANAASVGRP